MIRTTIVPTGSVVQLPIPMKYIGREVEVLVFTKEEISNTENPATSDEIVQASRFRGTLSNEEAVKIDSYLQGARGEWDRDS